MPINQLQLQAIRENSHAITGEPGDYRPLMDEVRFEEGGRAIHMRARSVPALR